MSSSRQTSRTRAKMSSTPTSAAAVSPYLQDGVDSALLPEGALTEEAVELLHEFVHPHPQSPQRHGELEASGEGGRKRTMRPRRGNGEVGLGASDELEHNGGDEDGDGDEDELEDWKDVEAKPWYRRPSALWILCVTPFTSTAMSACLAPKVEILTLLACIDSKPEYMRHRHGDGDGGGIGTEPDWSLGSGPGSTLNVNYYGSTNTYLPNYALLSPVLAEGIYSGRPTSIENFNINASFVAQSTDTDSKISKCSQDPVVAAATAKIIAALAITTGILSCLTTAFWGQFSDKHGRIKVIALAIFGTLTVDLTFILVFFFSTQLPGGYWFLLTGALIDGLCGGIATLVATTHSYYADCSVPGTRARVFSLGLGLMFTGIAIGPTLGSLLIHFTGSPISVFVYAALVHSVFLTYALLFIPESLPARTRAVNRQLAEERKRKDVLEDGVVRRVKRLFAFIHPLGELTPMRVPVERVSKSTQKKTKLDWSLTFVALCFGFSHLVLASYQYKFQYAQMKFHWTSQELGYWLTIIGAARAVFLVAILPAIIKFFNPSKPAIQLPVSSSTSPLSPSPESSNTPLRSQSQSPKSNSKSKLDLHIARLSLLLECASYIIMALIPTVPVFALTGFLLSFAGGLNPALQALALEMYVRRRRSLMGLGTGTSIGTGTVGGEGEEGEVRKEDEFETGRLFGALGVVSSISSAIIGPALFGFTFIETVGSHPIAIFWLSALCIGISFVLICLVRVPSLSPPKNEIGNGTEGGDGGADAVSSSACGARGAFRNDSDNGNHEIMGLSLELEGNGNEETLPLLTAEDDSTSTNKNYDSLRGRTARSRSGSSSGSISIV